MRPIVFRRDMNQLRQYCYDNELLPTRDITIAHSANSLRGLRGQGVTIVLLKDWQERHNPEEQKLISHLVERLKKEGATVES